MESIQQLDSAVFQLVNVTWSNSFFDLLLPWWREKWLWAPFYLFLVAFILQNWQGRKAAAAIIGLALAVGIADFTSSTIIKKNVQRLRPCNDPAMETVVIQRVDCGSGYSFTSSHAANHFAVAVYVGILFGSLGGWVWPVLLSWAFLVAYAQVYVGVHYPGDVLVGGVWGAVIGWWAALSFKKWIPQ